MVVVALALALAVAVAVAVAVVVAVVVAAVVSCDTMLSCLPVLVHHSSSGIHRKCS
jgi:hypothetical protein